MDYATKMTVTEDNNKFHQNKKADNNKIDENNENKNNCWKTVTARNKFNLSTNAT